MLAARAALDAARARARQAGARLNPEARLDVESFGGSGPYRGFQSVETTLGVAQTFELGGKRRTRAAAAEAEVAVAELRLTVAQVDVVRDVRVAFAEAQAAQDRVGLAREALSRAEDLARVAQLLVDVGREPPLRAPRARTVVSEATSALTAALTQAQTARSTLAGLYGSAEPPGQVAPGSSSAVGDAMPGEAARSLDVRFAEAQLEAARAIIARERALATPNVTVEAGARRYSDSDDHAFVLSLSAPIPIRDRNRGAVAAAAADSIAAEVRRNQALAAAIRAEREARAALDSARVQVATLETAAVRGAQEALRLARLGYDAGRFTLLDVLDAEAALTTARTNLAEARLQRARAEAALDRALAR